MRRRWAYPPNWEDLARQCKQQVNWRCEACGVAQGAIAISQRTGVVYQVYLAASHLDHDIWNPQPRLRALCPSCHGKYNHSRRERARWLSLERLRHQWLIERWRAKQRSRNTSP